MVCGLRKSIRDSASATTIAFLPSGVKYRLYGSATGTGGPGLPVFGLIGVRLLPSVSLTHSTEPFQDGVMWLGCPPTAKVLMILKVCGLISLTVSLRLLGT